MPFQPGRYGPWPGGLNARDADVAPVQVDAQQLRELVNLDVTGSGVLQARPGCRFAGSPAMYTAIGVAGRFSLLGQWAQGSKLWGLVSAQSGATPGVSTFYYTEMPESVAPADWPVMPGGTVAGKFSTTVQYQGFLYLVPTPGWTGSVGQRRADPTAGAWAAVAAMPAGDAAFMVRDRMFVVDKAASRVYYSKATDPTVWAAPDGGNFDVNPGDGATIRAVVVVNSQLYLFKADRTYLFTFGGDPALNGELTLLNDQLGAADALAWETGILLVNRNGVYQLQSNYFSRLDLLAPAVDVIGADVGFSGLGLALENDSLIIGRGSPFSHQAMNLRTQAWSARIYPDAAVGPGPGYLPVRVALGTTDLQSWNLYGDDGRVLSVTPLGPPAARRQAVLDQDSAGNIVSPRYSLTTTAVDGGDITSFKGMRMVAAHLRNRLPAGDAAVQCRVYGGTETAGVLDHDLTAVRESVAVPTGQWGGKVALTPRRLLSLALGLDKPQTTLSPAVSSARTLSDLQVRALQLQIDVRGGSARV